MDNKERRYYVSWLLRDTNSARVTKHTYTRLTLSEALHMLRVCAENSVIPVENGREVEINLYLED